jgi:hypothetical protein
MALQVCFERKCVAKKSWVARKFGTLHVKFHQNFTGRMHSHVSMFTDYPIPTVLSCKNIMSQDCLKFCIHFGLQPREKAKSFDLKNVKFAKG